MPRKKRKRNASRGSVNNIILKTLVTGDKYGYEIIKEVEEFSDGKIQLKQPSLYSSLSRFEEKEFVTSYWGDSDIGGRRHYYHLTELGQEYYRKFVLKELDESVEEVLEDNNITLSSSTENDTEDIDTDEDQDDEQDNDELESSNDSSNIITEISEEDIPAIADFDNEESATSSNDMVYDHKFYQPTPMDNMIDDTKVNSSQSIVEENVAPTTSIVDNTSNDQSEEDNNWSNFVTRSKESIKKCSSSNYNTMYLRKPKKEQVIVKDRDGIYKLRDEDYVPETKKYEPVVIDNVVGRSSNSNFSYTTYTETTNKSDKSPKDSIVDLSDEEKNQRNENFLAKFNLLTMSKMKPVSTPVKQTPTQTSPVADKPVDYRNELGKIYKDEEEIEEDDYVDLDEDSITDNRLFDYDEEDNWNNQESAQDSIISLESDEEFDVKHNDTEYIEQINNYSTPASNINMTRYENTTKAVLVDKTYMLVNKLKLVFGIIMTLIMTTEIVVSWVMLNSRGLITPNGKTILILSCVAIGIFALCCIIPYILNSGSHKVNTFRFKYTFWFGILTFIVITILVYCFNALGGFELDNFKHFATTIIVPIVMATNFCIGPIVYFVLTKLKLFFD